MDFNLNIYDANGALEFIQIASYDTLLLVTTPREYRC